MKPSSLLTTPVDIESPSLNFARHLNTNEKPFYVSVKAAKGAELNECYSNVDKFVAAHGGERMLGWQIWEWPNYFAEAEAHAVWKSSSGEYLDVTPKEESKILFIPDPRLSFDGDRVNNIRVALLDSEIVSDFIALGNARHDLFGSIPNGVRLEQWQVRIGARLDEASSVLPRLFRRNARVTQLCPCKSGLNYYDCHRGEIKRTLEMACKLIDKQ